MGIKRALTVGINYPGQSSQLRGCVNDSNTIVNMLRNRFGFTNIVQVLDNDATTQRIKRELHNLVNGSRPGDVLFFHYSGHGTQIIDDDDADYEPDGLDEVICPVDFNWRDKVIRDDDLKEVFDCVPAGVNLTVFLDCCNSGGGFDALNEHRYDVEEHTDDDNGAGRYLEPPPAIKAKIEASRLAPKTRSLSRNVDATGMLISGSQADQTSADALIDGVYQGATTYALQSVLEELGASVTNHEVVHGLNRFMVTYNFSQRPQLDGPVKLHDKVFLKAYDFGDHDAVAVHVEKVTPEDDQPYVVADNQLDKPTVNVTVDQSTTVNVGVNTPTPTPNKKKDDDKKKKKLMIGGGIALIVILVLVFVL